MPQGKEYCAGENDYFDSGVFELVDGWKLHKGVDPLHSALDGQLVEIVDGKVKPVDEIAIDPPLYIDVDA
jgi:hypothetical protein